MKKILTFISIAALLVLAGCNKKSEPTNEDSASQDKIAGTVTDICGNKYNYVKIGEQYWMAENMRCNKYDTKSERPNATISSTSESYSYAPYYTNASDKSTWDDECLYSESLSDTQIQQLGLLYNWAAAVGLATEAEALAQVTEFNGKRQGICPNGWHIPTKTEWNVLIDYAGGQRIAGKKLKATSGWSNAYGDLIPGVDEFGFAALPASKGYGNKVECLGRDAWFWTATPGSQMISSNKNDASHFFTDDKLTAFLDEQVSPISPNKNHTFSVRCVKNDSNSTDDEDTNTIDNTLTAIIAANATYTGTYLEEPNYETEASIVFTNVGGQTFRIGLPVDLPKLTDPTTIFMVGTWSVRNAVLTLNTTKVYGTAKTITISGAVENGGYNLTLKSGERTFIMEATNPKTDIDGNSIKLESIAFKQKEYAIQEDNIDFFLKKELQTIPSITNTAKIQWTISDENIAVMEGGFLVPKKAGIVNVTATIQDKSAECTVTIFKKNITLIDICGNTYNCIRIGSRYWMAENMRCNKYDTQSERPGATLSTSGSQTFAPYYTDASNKRNWYSSEYSENLSEEQISKLGCLYNWAAAVGLETEEEAQSQTNTFIGNRQGICPNDWHIPTTEEYRILINNAGYYNAGKMLKATSGWYRYNGFDTYSFSILPAGYAKGGEVYSVGNISYLWTSSSDYDNRAHGYTPTSDGLLSTHSSSKQLAQSVRCIKN